MKKPKLSLYIFIAVGIAAVTLLVILLSPVMGDPPAVYLPDAQTGAPGTSPDANAVYPKAEITRENVQSVIKSLDPAISYSREVTVTTFWSGGESAQLLRIYADSGKLRVTEVGLARVKNTLYSSGKLYIWYDDGSGGVFSGEADGDTADTLTRSLSLSRALGLPADSIVSAGYTDFDGYHCVFAEFITETLRYRERFYVDVETGLLVAEDCYSDDTLIYTLRSGATDPSTPAQELFNPPG